MLSLNYENINYVMTQILKLSCVSFSYVSISYVLANLKEILRFYEMEVTKIGPNPMNRPSSTFESTLSLEALTNAIQAVLYKVVKIG